MNKTKEQMAAKEEEEHFISEDEDELNDIDLGNDK